MPRPWEYVLTHGIKYKTEHIVFDKCTKEDVENLARTLARKSEHVSHITSVEISSSTIGDTGIISLLKNTNLKKITIYNSEVEIKEFEALTEGIKESQVKYLDLRQNSIGDAVAVALAGGIGESQITCLNLNNNQIGDKGIEALAEVIKDSQVEYLSLYRNNISLNGGLALAEGIKDSKISFINASENFDELLFTDPIKNNKERFSSEMEKFKGIFLNDKQDAFKDLEEIFKSEELELVVETIEKSGINAFAKHLKEHFTKISATQEDLASELSKIIDKYSPVEVKEDTPITQEIQVVGEEDKQTKVTSDHKIAQLEDQELEKANSELKTKNFQTTQPSSSSNDKQVGLENENLQLRIKLLEQEIVKLKERESQKQEENQKLQSLMQDLQKANQDLQSRYDALNSEFAQASQTPDPAEGIQLEGLNSKTAAYSQAESVSSWNVVLGDVDQSHSHDDVGLSGEQPYPVDPHA